MEVNREKIEAWQASSRTRVTRGSPLPKKMSFAYPKQRRCSQTDVYHGDTVADPYRYLEVGCGFGRDTE